MRIETELETVKSYGVDCGRVLFRAYDDNGTELAFAWTEQNWYHRDGWSAWRWSDQVGPVLIGSSTSKDNAASIARQYVERVG
jgi:hypothetical protein